MNPEWLSGLNETFIHSNIILHPVVFFKYNTCFISFRAFACYVYFTTYFKVMLVLPFPCEINNYYSCLYLSHLGFCALLVVLKTTYPHSHSAVDKITMKLFYGNKLCSVSPLFHPSSCKVSDTNISQCLSGHDYWQASVTVLWLVVSSANIYIKFP